MVGERGFEPPARKIVLSTTMERPQFGEQKLRPIRIAMNPNTEKKTRTLPGIPSISPGQGLPTLERLSFSDVYRSICLSVLLQPSSQRRELFLCEKTDISMQKKLRLSPSTSHAFHAAILLRNLRNFRQSVARHQRHMCHISGEMILPLKQHAHWRQSGGPTPRMGFRPDLWRRGVRLVFGTLPYALRARSRGYGGAQSCLRLIFSDNPRPSPACSA